MGRLALTLWFAVTTLLGPGVCCCSVASAAFTSPNGRLAAVSVKSCCDQDAPPCCPAGKDNNGPGKPSKCPCEKGKQLTTLPTVVNTSADLAAQLRLIDSPFGFLLPVFTFDPSTVGSSATYTTPQAVRPAGRDLLAVYSLLRC